MQTEYPGDPAQPQHPQPQAQPQYRAPAAPQAQPAAKKKGRGWLVVGVVLVVLVALAGCCLWPFVLLVGSAGTGADLYGPGVAVIHIDGIISGTGSTGTLGGGSITPEYMIDLLHAADEDPTIEAIVLRIDSPGGTVAASQEIAMEVARLEKPVVASVGDVAASGAYWIASQCDLIVAAPGSAIGSIGVILQIPNYEGLMDMAGVEFTILTKGEFKDTGSPYRSMNATELAMLDEDMEIVYEMFIEGVADGRDMEIDEVRELATGWAWSAAQAQGMGLVDELGTYSDGLDHAADLAGLDEYEVIYYDEASPLDWLYWFMSATESLSKLAEGPLGAAGTPPVAR